MPSGKQILLSILSELSQKRSPDLNEATDRLNPAMLVHASTAYDTWFKVEKHSWLHEDDSEFDSVRQGIGLNESKVFLLDLFECMMDSPEVASRVKEKFPSVSEDDYEDSTFIIWQLLRSLEYDSNYDSIENEGKLDMDERDRFIDNYLQKLNYHREDPEGYHNGEFPSANKT